MAEPMQPAAGTTPPPSPTVPVSRSRAKTAVIAGIAFLLIGGTGLAVYFLSKRQPRMSANDLFLGMFDRVTAISAAEYEGLISLAAEPRAAGARPFTPRAQDAAAEKAQFARDENRFRDLEEISRKVNGGGYLPGIDSVGGRELPATLEAAGVANTNDPATRAPYRYTRAPDKKTATLTIAFETAEAVGTVESRSATGFPLMPRQESVKVEGQTVTFTLGPGHFHYYSFSGEPSEPFFAEFFEGRSGFLESVPKSFTANVRATGLTAKTAEAPADARFTLQGEGQFGNFALDFAGELVKKDHASYVRVTSPAHFIFFDLSSLINTWVKIVPEDFAGSGFSFLPFMGFLGAPGIPSFGNQQGLKLLEHFQLLLRIAKEEGAFAVRGDPVPETLDGAQTYRYSVGLNREKVLPFYTRFTEEAATRFEKSALVKQNPATIRYLHSEQFGELFDYLAGQMDFTIWINRETGYPVRFAFAARYIPSDETRELADSELVFGFDTRLANINEPKPVAAPETFITFLEAQDLFSGLTKEEGLFRRQTENIRRIQTALGTYKDAAGRYPERLTELLVTRKELEERFPRRATPTPTFPFPFSGTVNPFSLLGEGGLVPFDPNAKLLSAIPNDIYTGKPYAYRPEGAINYRLTYTIRVPRFSGKLNYAFRPYDLERYAEGVNTATAETISVEGKNQAGQDADGDTLSDALERYYGTDPRKRDTDGDGYSDQEEISRDFDPRGPGKLERNTGGLRLFGF